MEDNEVDDMLASMAFFSLLPLLVSLAGGLVTRWIIWRRARAAITRAIGSAG